MDRAVLLANELVTTRRAGGGWAGIWLIEQLSRSWGVNRHPGSGKVVWCVLSL